MTRIRTATAGLLVLAATALSGCGDESGDPPADAPSDTVAQAPADADAREFCEALVAEPPGSDSDDPAELQESIGVYAEGLTTVGTPADLDGEAREGFEIYVALRDDLDDEQARIFAEGDDDALYQLFDDDDGAKVRTFYEAAGRLCTAGG